MKQWQQDGDLAGIRDRAALAQLSAEERAAGEKVWADVAALTWAPAPPPGAWPQWRGPDRSGVSREKGLLKSWPQGGPTLLWASDEAGTGYAGVAVVGDRLYSMGGDRKNELVFALDARTGKKAWSTVVGPFFHNGWGGGPRSTPTVAGGFVYALSARGALACVKASNGDKVWSVDLAADLGVGWKGTSLGHAEGPLVDGDLVIVTPGGPKGTLAALDRRTGKLLWRSKAWTDAAAHSSVVPATLHGVRQYVQLAATSVAGTSAKDGSLLWRFARTGSRNSVATPIVFDNHVYVTSAEGYGANLLKISHDGKQFSAADVYDAANRKVMQSQHGGVVLFAGHVYGHSGSAWLCQDWKTGKEVWKSTALGKGSLTCADGHLYLFGEQKGECVLIEASPNGWKEKGRFTLPRSSKLPRPPHTKTGNCFTHPVVADGRLYLRDQEVLLCYDVRQ
jgi:outer membrane protein assembly factor BamB